MVEKCAIESLIEGARTSRTPFALLFFFLFLLYNNSYAEVIDHIFFQKLFSIDTHMMLDQY
jgi:hypothetical protein